MARYIQKISLGSGKERWVGWEIDGVGTEISGLTLADQFTEEELAAKGVRRFIPMAFDDFLRLGAVTSAHEQQSDSIDDQDLEFRLDALLVGLERMRSHGVIDVPENVLLRFFGGEMQKLEDQRVQSRFQKWQEEGAILLVRRTDCYLKILRRLA